MAGKKPAKPSSSKGGAIKNQKSPPPQTITENRESEEDLRRQQTLLNIFSNTFREVLEADDFPSQLQELKGALFNRDFEGAFAREEALDVYAARWSPTRALCYARILRGLDSHLRGLVGDASSSSSSSSSTGVVDGETSIRKGGDGDGREMACDESVDEEVVRNTEAVEEEEASTTPEEQRDVIIEESKAQSLKILAIGGAAAEIVAFADYISSSQPSITNTTTTTPTTPLQGEITLLDIGPWASVTTRLQTALTSVPLISRYASSATKAANVALISSQHFRSRFFQKDILSLSVSELATLIPVGGGGGGNNEKHPILITLLFTLNELYTAGGIKRTTTFLRQLSSSSVGLPPGSLLLVVDSPGSYSEAAVGGGGKDGKQEKKRYPMQWLLEHTLIPPPPPPPPSRRKEEEEESPDDVADEDDEEKKKGGIRWEKIESHDSVWFRVAEGLRYPIALENMRYQMHLYRACCVG
ncbi:hypothetical protein FHL15_008819 [Xylaria flabelliformis]|uniref:25S rRNA (Uridine(2843)-N(3))-methyltransferase n=1 Tax=Xylaria flabelliformis TaxID=2512241 RepID=A0A553HQN5_9PEZI|nr:hypothetical protein FHL15_008819 [Xylaria flabelliformis]